MVMPLVSIIVPVYNVELYLEKCLKSLLLQSLKNIEIIVVNDGSSDGSWGIMERYQKDHPGIIKIFSKENGGLSDARNFGLDQATGQFIGFVDSDDYVTEEMFEEMYSLAMSHSAEMVICNIQKVNENGVVTQKLVQIPNLPEKIALKDNFSVFSDISYFACNKLFRKELFTDHRFKVGAHFEDIQLIPQLLLKCTIVAHTQNYHYQYFERSNSISKTHTERGLDILQAVRDVEFSFGKSQFKNHTKDLQGFQVLEGVYTFLAYLAFVKDEKLFYSMANQLDGFIKERNLSLLKILTYKRYGRNYLLSMPLKKQIFYILYFMNMKKMLRKLIF